MTFAQRLAPVIDMESTKKAFILLSGLVLLAIPVQAAVIYSSKHTLTATQLPKTESSALLLEPQNVYLKVFDQGTLFGGPISASGSSQALLSSATDKIKDYRLLGVVLGGVAEAIVSDARTQRSDFVKIGERVGDLTVKDIREGFIVLDYMNNEVKLEIQ